MLLAICFLQTSNLPYISQEYYRASFTGRPQRTAPKLRVHFAAGYFDAKYERATSFSFDPPPL